MKKIWASAIIVLLLSIMPFSLWRPLKNKSLATTETIVVDVPTTWTSGSAPVGIHDTTYIFNSDLTIEEGVFIYLSQKARIIVRGNLTINGTEENPVIFEGVDQNGGDNFSIDGEGNRTEIHYTEFHYGGVDDCLTLNRSNKTHKSYLNLAQAQSCVFSAALDVSSPEILISNSTFTYNLRALNVFEGASNTHLIENIFHHSRDHALLNNAGPQINAQINCWERPSGPSHVSNPEGKGEVVVGDVNYSFWQDCGSDFKPVIIVPGVGGSWNWERMLEISAVIDWWSFTPFSHTYENLEDSFKDRGYRKNKDYYIAFYDWRQDNHQSMEEFLKPTIEKIKNTSFDEKYDIIAHSMGGYVTLDYLYDESYGGEIDKVVLEGVPFLGASKVYPVWEGGVVPKDWQPMNLYLWYLSKKSENRESDYYDLVHKYTPSARQLLPLYNYVQKNDTGEVLNTWEMAEQNDYLPALFNKIMLNQHQFSFNNILMIEGTDVDTSRMIYVDEYTGEGSDKLWKDGKPNPYPLTKEIAQGDGTVLNESSNGLPFIPSIQLNDVEHKDLPTLALNDMSDFLGIERPTKEYKLASKEQLIMVFACPIDVKVVAPDGTFISKDEVTAEGGYYYSDGNDDGYKIVEFLDPQEGEYKIEMTGNEDGEYDALVLRTDGEQSAETEVSGEVQAEEEIEYKVVASKEEVIVEKETKDTIPPTINIVSPQNGEEYFNGTEIEVDYSVSDDVSLEGKIEIEAKLDGEVFEEDKIDPVYLSLGEHTFSITATDGAGNVAEEISQFGLITNYDSLIQNINRYYDDGLIKRKSSKKFIIHWLYHLKFLEKHKDQVLGFITNPKTKQKVEAIFNQIIDWRTDFLIKYLQKQSGEGIDEKATNLLIEGLEYIGAK